MGWWTEKDGLLIGVVRTDGLQAVEGLRHWGTPTDVSQLSSLFTSYLHSDPSTPTTPFCDLPLSPESSSILPHLVDLNSAKFQHWTVGSQPAVDSARSGDRVHGWGPPGGYVFQKAFVEFFVREEEVARLEDCLEGRIDGQVSMYAANRKVSRAYTVLLISTGRLQKQHAERRGQRRYVGCLPRPGDRSIHYHRGDLFSCLEGEPNTPSRTDSSRKRLSTSGRNGHCFTLDNRPLGSCSTG